jgi:hypothetical protein
LAPGEGLAEIDFSLSNANPTAADDNDGAVEFLTGARANHESVLYQLRRQTELSAAVVGATSTLSTACFRNGLLLFSHSRAFLIAAGVAFFTRRDCGSRYNVNARARILEYAHSSVSGLHIEHLDCYCHHMTVVVTNERNDDLANVNAMSEFENCGRIDTTRAFDRGTRDECWIRNVERRAKLIG